jgi:hypothetical protein
MKKMLAVLLVTAPALVAAQGPAPQRSGQAAAPSAATVPDANAKGTAIIRGRILLGDGRPGRRAAVRLQPPGDSAPRVVSADLAGRYEFTEVRLGEYRVSAGKPGYLGLEYGQRRTQEPGALLTIKAGETLDRIDMTLPASGAITGRVMDEYGDPIQAVDVTLWQPVFAANRRQLVPVPGIGGGATNDQGRYRLYAVPPGQYVVVARPADAPVPPGYTSTYFPGNPHASGAKPVTVGVSQEVAGVDIPLARVTGARLSGVVVDSTGKPIMARVSLIPALRSGGSVMVDWMSKVSDHDGRFEIASVSPGEWVLQAAAVAALSSRQQEGEFVSQHVSVSGADLRDLHLQLSAGSHVAGHIVFDGVGSADPAAVRIGTVPADVDRAPFMGRPVALPNGIVTGTPALVTSPATATAEVKPDGSFELDALNGPRRFRLIRAPASWSVKTIRANGRDVTDEPLSFGRKDESLTDVEIVLTNRAASVAGVVTDARGRPAAGSVVLAFATDPDRWYQGSRFLAFTRAGSDGSFAVVDLPQGEYHVAAIDWMQGSDSYGEWQDPEFLASIAPRATRIILADGQAMSATPRLIVR